MDLSAKDDLLKTSEQMRLITIFSSLGVDKLRFTGGEPTINSDLCELIRHGRSMPNMGMIGITTNGVKLRSQLDGLVEAGLSSVNISLDTLNPEKFATITRRSSKHFHKVLSSIYAAVAQGLKVKVNVVVMRDFNYEEISQFVDLTKELELDVRFIEMMPFHDNSWEMKKLVSYYEILDNLRNEGGDKVLAQIPSDDKNDTTKWYRASGYLGRVGFITSMSNNFCGSCNRLRITADGKLKVCLFGEESYSLVDSLRSRVFYLFYSHNHKYTNIHTQKYTYMQKCNIFFPVVLLC